MRQIAQKLVINSGKKLKKAKENRKSFLNFPPVKIYTSRNINSMIIILSTSKNYKLCKEIEILYNEQHYSNAGKIHRRVHQNA